MTDNSGGSNFSVRSAINIIDYLYQLRYALLFWSFALALDIFLLEYGLDGLISLQWNTITSFPNIGIIFLFLTIYALFMSITIPLCNGVLTWLLHKVFFYWLKDKWELIIKSEHQRERDTKHLVDFIGNLVHRIKVQDYTIKEKDSTAMKIYEDQVSSHYDSIKEHAITMNLYLSYSILTIYDMYYTDESSLLNYLHKYNETWFGFFVISPVFLIPLAFIFLLFEYVRREKNSYTFYLYSPYLAEKIRSKGKEPRS